MPKLPRIFQKIFGSNAGVDQIGKFGSLAAGTPEYTTDLAEVQELSNFDDGWYGAVLGNNSPAIQDVNALDYLITAQLAYLFQAGIPEWNEDTVYYIGSLATDSTGKIYRSLTDDNEDNALTEPTHWALITNDVIPSGSAFVLFQASAPTGWTKLVTQNDKFLRVVSGTGGGAGGTFSNLSHTHTGPSHTHGLGAGHAKIEAGYIDVTNTNYGRARLKAVTTYTATRQWKDTPSGGTDPGSSASEGAELGGTTDAGGTGATGTPTGLTHDSGAHAYIDVIVCTKD
jgi:hypothetical protein